ncbi:MAG: ATP-dependent serine peptidase containing a PDZ domain protein, partial [Pseudolysinimonas sp.]
MSLFPDNDAWIRPDPRLGPVARDPRAVSSLIGWILLIGAVAGTVVLGTLSAPFVKEKPGPVYDTIGEIDLEGTSTPVIDVTGEKTYPTEGSLDMLTVVLEGSPQSPLTWIDIALAWFDPTRAIIPIEAVYPAGTTDEEENQQSAA